MDCLSICDRLRLPAVMRECAVSVGHLVRVFTLLDSGAAVVRCVHEFAGKAIDHGRFVALARSSDQPADGESLTALRTNVDRDLVSCTADAARTHFNVRSNVVEGGVEHAERLLLRLALNDVECAVNDAFRNRLLAVKHDGVHELGDDQITELRIRVDLTLFCTMATGHILCLSMLLTLYHAENLAQRRNLFEPELLRTLRTVLGAALLAVLDALGIENTADDVVTHARQVLYAAAADHDHGVFLKVVTFARNVADDFEAVGEADLGNLTQSRVRLLRGRRVNAGANTTLLRVFLKSRNLVALYLCLAGLADQLVYGRHITIPCKNYFSHPHGWRLCRFRRRSTHISSCAKRGPIRFHGWTTKSRGRRMRRLACNIRVFYVQWSLG
ncbi:30S ribosomal protein S7 (modular protein) [Agrobacterium genomosp. 5 str. CFBP 6626]|nr:30S ribosomal protein S7 (modular protein) [Agrobacterium genomosp. 5 str. CFBP 6626]